MEKNVCDWCGYYIRTENIGEFCSGDASFCCEDCREFYSKYLAKQKKSVNKQKNS